MAQVAFSSQHLFEGSPTIVKSNDMQLVDQQVQKAWARVNTRGLSLRHVMKKRHMKKWAMIASKQEDIEENPKSDLVQDPRKPKRRKISRKLTNFGFSKSDINNTSAKENAMDIGFETEDTALFLSGSPTPPTAEEMSLAKEQVAKGKKLCEQSITQVASNSLRKRRIRPREDINDLQQKMKRVKI